MSKYTKIQTKPCYMQLSTKNSSENHTQCTRISASALTSQHATAEAFASFQPKSQTATSLALHLSWQLQLLSF